MLFGHCNGQLPGGRKYEDGFFGIEGASMRGSTKLNDQFPGVRRYEDGFFAIEESIMRGSTRHGSSADAAFDLDALSTFLGLGTAVRRLVSL